MAHIAIDFRRSEEALCDCRFQVQRWDLHVVWPSGLHGSIRCIFCNFAARIPVTSLGASGRELNYTARDPAETPFGLFFQLDDLMNVGKMVSYFSDALDRGESD